MIGNALSGLIVIVSPCGQSSRRVLHISFGCPFTSALHEPHFAALQFQRQQRSGAPWPWIQWTASSTTIPVSTGTLYSLSSPPAPSPRQTLKLHSPIKSGPHFFSSKSFFN